jgi:RNA polymerase sigma-70 factor (ECF subfamily)
VWPIARLANFPFAASNLPLRAYDLAMSLTLSPSSPALFSAVAPMDEPSRIPRRDRMSTGDAPTPPDDRNATDARLLQQVARGDKVAFAALYDRFSGPLFATALRIVHDNTEAQDVVHDTFVTVWQKAATFEITRGSAFSWVVTLVRNRAIDRVRRRRRRSDLLAASAPDDLGYDENNGMAGVDQATTSDEARAVRAAVAKLPVEQQRAVELAFFSGLTQEQIAEKLAEPLGTVKARIRRGLLKLRDALAHRL